jgi:hypothetical protein
VKVDPKKYPALAEMLRRDLGEGDDDGGASVREPRRPKRPAPATAAAREKVTVR